MCLIPQYHMKLYCRAATIVSTEECILWALDRTTFRQLVLLTTMKKREMYESFLNAIPLLQELEVRSIYGLGVGGSMELGGLSS